MANEIGLAYAMANEIVWKANGQGDALWFCLY
jgi:hypothetical protein